MADVSPTHLEEHASLMYVRWDDLYKIVKPFQIFCAIPSDAVDQRRSNINFSCAASLVTDARPNKSSYTLNTNGFAFRDYPTALEKFDNTDDIEKIYLPELDKLLQVEFPGAEKIPFWDWRV